MEEVLFTLDAFRSIGIWRRRGREASELRPRTGAAGDSYRGMPSGIPRLRAINRAVMRRRSSRLGLSTIFCLKKYLGAHSARAACCTTVTEIAICWLVDPLVADTVTE